MNELSARIGEKWKNWSKPTRIGLATLAVSSVGVGVIKDISVQTTGPIPRVEVMSRLGKGFRFEYPYGLLTVDQSACLPDQRAEGFYSRTTDARVLLPLPEVLNPPSTSSSSPTGYYRLTGASHGREQCEPNPLANWINLNKELTVGSFDKK